ncbi:hypothetical protein ZIOFF_041571 [Zingiber officinale]|uniref:C3H1-type domain-containing protein n=1 Tax=Zingiber officinale TaxID=94328 RepID=A0A8J5GHN4_ZINOF|nr:hypothetical protein ZIOFF_041571 [Zingiber officinale]
MSKPVSKADLYTANRDPWSALGPGVGVPGEYARLSAPPASPSEELTGADRTAAVEDTERVDQPVCEGEKECAFYIKTGQCKFGATCKFHHPQPAGPSVTSAAPAFYPTVEQLFVPSPRQYPTYVGWQLVVLQYHMDHICQWLILVCYILELFQFKDGTLMWFVEVLVFEVIIIWAQISYSMAFMQPRHQWILYHHHLLANNQFEQDRYMDHQANYLLHNHLCLDLKYLLYQLLYLQALA